jgi:hypothetical protein
LEAAGFLLRVATTLAVVGAFAAAAASVLMPREVSRRLRPYGNAAIGTAAGVFVLHLQRGGLGTSFGGVVLAVSAGALAVLIMTLFRSV